MTIEITEEQQRMIDLAIASGAFRDSSEVIGTALAMLFEEIEDGIVSEAREVEPRFTLDEVEAELRAVGKTSATIASSTLSAIPPKQSM